MANKKKVPLVLVGAKVPIEIKNAIEKQAEKEERSVSQVVARLLSSHPTLKNAEKAESVIT